MPEPHVLRAGFVGLGNIGGPMARHLAASELSTMVFDVDEEAVAAAVEAGAEAAPSLRAMAESCEVVGICVRTPDQVRAVCDGDDGLFAADDPPVVALHSTLSLDDVASLGDTAAAAGVTLLDAPITGGATVAEAGELTYFVGGPAESVARAEPAFATSAALVRHCGELGDGTRWKLVNNLVTNVSFAAVMDGIALSEALGLPTAEVVEVLSSAGVLSDRQERVSALYQLPEGFVEEAGMAPQQEAYTEIAVKDLTAALAAAGDVDLPFAALALDRARAIYRVAD